VEKIGVNFRADDIAGGGIVFDAVFLAKRGTNVSTFKTSLTGGVEDVYFHWCVELDASALETLGCSLVATDFLGCSHLELVSKTLSGVINC
jgi:hypothetical protein